MPPTLYIKLHSFFSCQHISLWIYTPAMKLKLTLILAAMLFLTGSASIRAQDSSSTQTTTATTEEAPQSPDYMKIYGWVGGIVIAIVAIGVIVFEVRQMKADEEEESTEKSNES
jgi:hypothetical protein